MFDSIRRHQKWLWIVIMTVTIISFVAFFSPATQQTASNRGFFGQSPSVGSVNGRPLSEDEYYKIYREVLLRYWVSAGEWPRRQVEQMIADQIRARLLLIEKLEEMDVQVPESAVGKWIVQTFQDPNQKTFRKDLYDRLIKEELPNKGITLQDFERFVRHEVGIQHLIEVTGVSGNLVTPQEAEAQFRKEEEQVDTEVILLSATNYLDKVTIDPAALATFYTNQQANYRVPERVIVNYVKFDPTNYITEAEQAMNQITNLAQRIDEEYARRGTNAFTDSNNQPLPTEAAKEKIRTELRQQYSLIEARKKAIELANELFDLPMKPESLANLAAAKGLVLNTTPPFARNEVPPGLGVSQNFTEMAFKLTPTEPFPETPILTENAVYFIGFNSKVPSEIPPLETIRDRVVEDFRRSRATELVNAAGNELHSALTNAIAQGKSFQDAAKEANATVIDVPPVSQKTPLVPVLPNRADLTALKNAAFALKEGEISAFTPTRSGGLIVRLQAKVPVSAEKMSKEFPEYLAEMRRNRRYEAFTDWLRKELELAQIVLPSDKEEKQSVN